MEQVRTFLFPETFSNKENRFLFETTGSETPGIPEDDAEVDPGETASGVVGGLEADITTMSDEDLQKLRGDYYAERAITAKVRQSDGINSCGDKVKDLFRIFSCFCQDHRHIR